MKFLLKTSGLFSLLFLCSSSCVSFISYSGHTKLSIFYHFAKPDFLEGHLKKRAMPPHIPCTTTLITCDSNTVLFN